MVRITNEAGGKLRAAGELAVTVPLLGVVGTDSEAAREGRSRDCEARHLRAGSPPPRWSRCPARS
jgi:hypothetical protein